MRYDHSHDRLSLRLLVQVKMRNTGSLRWVEMAHFELMEVVVVVVVVVGVVVVVVVMGL